MDDLAAIASIVSFAASCIVVPVGTMVYSALKRLRRMDDSIRNVAKGLKKHEEYCKESHSRFGDDIHEILVKVGRLEGRVEK